MEAIKKQASRLREQVAKQQQTILRQLGQLGHEAIMIDDTELESFQQLESLYKSTRAAKHFQRDIVRGVEGFISTSKKQMQITRRLAEDCCKYGIENQSDVPHLAKPASFFGTTHVSVEDHREMMLGTLSNQVCEHLRASISGAPLEDARHLAHRYDRVRQEFEAQAADVLRRRSKCKDSSVESVIKLKNAEARLTELKSSMLALGREATSAMLSVEDQQQQLTFQKLVTMVDAERSYHQHAVALLEKLHSEMILVEQLPESSLEPLSPEKGIHSPSPHNNVAIMSGSQKTASENNAYFIAEVRHSFDAQGVGELGFSVGDYVIVRQVAANGWSEGECNGEAGWFPSAYVERKDRVSDSMLVK